MSALAIARIIEKLASKHLGLTWHLRDKFVVPSEIRSFAIRKHVQ